MAIDSNTKLLLQFEGDQSSYNHNITFGWANGILDSSTKAIGTSSYKPNDGKAEVAHHSAFNFGSSGDFTIECFFKRPETGDKHGLLLGKRLSWSTGDYNIFINADTDVVNFGHSGGTVVECTITDTSWHHLAVVRLSGVTKLYIDGTVEDTSSSTYTMDNTGTFIMGATPDQTFKFPGHIDEIRVSGTARYNGNFTPTATKFSSDANTVFLWHCEGDATGNHSINITSNSAITAEATDVKFTGAFAVSNNENTDAVLGPLHGDFNFGSVDWTIDWWQRINGYSGGSGYVFGFNLTGAVSIWTRNGGSPTSPAITINGSSLAGYSYGSDPADGDWHHYELCVSGGTFYMFWDGTLLNSTSSIGSINSPTVGLQLGMPQANPTSNLWSGQIDEFRISKGIARHISNLTPATAPYDQIGYGISGNLAEESKIFVLRHSDRTLLHEETVSAGDYEIGLNETDNIDVIAEPTGDGSPAVYTNVTPVLL